MAKLRWDRVIAGVAFAAGGAIITPGLPDGELLGMAILANEFGVFGKRF